MPRNPPLKFIKSWISDLETWRDFAANGTNVIRAAERLTTTSKHHKVQRPTRINPNSDAEHSISTTSYLVVIGHLREGGRRRAHRFAINSLEALLDEVSSYPASHSAGPTEEYSGHTVTLKWLNFRRN